MKYETMEILILEMGVLQQTILLKMDGYELEDPLLHLINVNYEHQDINQTIIKMSERAYVVMVSKSLENSEKIITQTQVMVVVHYVLQKLAMYVMVEMLMMHMINELIVTMVKGCIRTMQTIQHNE